MGEELDTSRVAPRSITEPRRSGRCLPRVHFPFLRRQRPSFPLRKNPPLSPVHGHGHRVRPGRRTQTGLEHWDAVLAVQRNSAWFPSLAITTRTEITRDPVCVQLPGPLSAVTPPKTKKQLFSPAAMGQPRWSRQAPRPSCSKALRGRSSGGPRGPSEAGIL